MSKKVFEDAPAPTPSGGNVDKVRKAARQLAYDVRYKVKGQFKDGQKTDASSLKRAYLQQLNKSPAPAPVKILAKKMLIGEEYDSFDLTETAKTNASCAYNKVFKDGYRIEEVEEVEEEAFGTKFTIRVTDKKTKQTYYRKADRAKISELRKNPNIGSVEITGRKEKDTYDKTGKNSGDKKAKKDYDGDGKVESGSKEHAGAVHNAIQRKKGGVADGQDTRKEEYYEEVIYEKEEKGEKKLDTMKGKNKVVVNPKLGEQVEKNKVSPEDKKQLEMKKRMLQKKMMMQKQAMQMQKQGKLALNYAEESNEIRYCPKCDKDETRDECKYGGEYWDENSKPAKAVDPRAVPTMVNLVKNKMRARGLNMSYDMEGNSINENSKKTPYGAKADKAVASVRDQLAKYSDEKLKKIRSQNKKPAPIGVKEAAEDRLRDQRMERGGVDGNTRYDRPPAKRSTNKELGIRDFTSTEKEKRAKEIASHFKKMRR